MAERRDFQCEKGVLNGVAHMIEKVILK